MAGGLINYRSNAGRKQRYRAMSDINVTPFVDVMLVLLIIFMVSAPLMTVGVPVDLPKTKASQLNDAEEPLVVSMRKDGSLFIQETEISIEDIAPRLLALSKQNTEVRIFIRADTSLNYGDVMLLMGRITEAGFLQVALLSTQP